MSERDAIGRMIDKLHGDIFRVRDKQAEAERTVDNCKRLEASLLEEAAALARFRELTNPYRKGGAV